MNRILVVAPSWIGDAIMAQPLFSRLLEKYPEARIDALAPAWVAPILQRMPEITEVILNPFRHGELALRARWQLAQTMTKKKYDAAYVLPNSLKSALLPWLSGIPKRVGFTGEMRYGLINERHRLDKKALPMMVMRFAELAENSGTLPASPLPFPRLISTAATQKETLLALLLTPPKKMVMLCPGAEYGPAKRWPPSHFAALSTELSEAGYTVCLLGSEKDAAISKEITAQTPLKPIDLCGKTTISQAVDLLALADVAVCNDSGLMHVAAAVGIRLVALYGSSSPDFTPPLSEKATVLRLPLECSPCFQRVCPQSHFNCLRQLSVKTVRNAVLQTE